MFGALGAGPQVGAQLVTVAGGGGAEVGQHLLRISANPACLGPRSFLGYLRADDFLLCQPGGLFCLCDRVAGLVPIGLGGADLLVGLGARLLDRGDPVGFRGDDPSGGVLAGLLDACVPVGFGGGAGCLCLVGAGLGRVSVFPSGVSPGCGAGSYPRCVIRRRMWPRS